MKIPEKLLQSYINRRIEELDQIDSALHNKEYDLLFKIGHQLKGNGAMYGFPEISSFGELVETGATQHDINAIQLQFSSYRNFITKLSNK